MKAIETRYKGYRFRSRLEARWAVFFDALGVKWEYEPEGFELGGGVRYLPDFFIHIDAAQAESRGWTGKGYGYWVEIKGKHPTQDEVQRLGLVCQHTQHHGVIFYGPPGDDCGWISISTAPRVPMTAAQLAAVLDQNGVLKDIGLTASVSMCMPASSTARSLIAASEAARGARFEFGESGARA